MLVQRIDHDEGPKPTFCSIPEDLQDVIAASPAVASLLPGIMRAMAVEIEKATHTHVASADLPQHETSWTVEAAARKVVTDISKGLGQHLALSCRPQSSAISRKQGRAPAEAHALASKPPIAGQLDGPQLRLKLLGTPQVSLDGVRLRALERCNRAALILYILALHRQGLSVERLAAYIASESSDIDAFDTDAGMKLGAVRTFIWRLRRTACWPDIVVSPGELSAPQNRYRLPDNTTCDVWEFESNLDGAAGLAVRASIEPWTADQAAALRQNAILLYGGEFCKGVGAGAIAHAAGYLHHRYVQAVMQQAIYWKDKALTLREIRRESNRVGDLSVEEEKAWLEALSNYRLAAQVEPYDESAHEGVLLCRKQLARSSPVQKRSRSG